MRMSALIFGIIHGCLFLWTRDSDFFVGAMVFLAAYMIISARAA